MRKTFRVVTILGVGVVLAVGGTVGGKAVLSNARQAEACEGLQAYLQDPGLLVQSPTGAPGVAALGDSYTAGDGLDDRGDGWAYQVAGTVAGVGSTGFVSGGYCGKHSYAERVAAVLETRPETLIIQGGLNDTSADPGELQVAADALLKDATSVPRVVVVGPVDAPARDGEQAVDEALAEAAQEAGAEYVSALDWELEFLPDDLHLTPQGHQEFADRVQKHMG